MPPSQRPFEPLVSAGAHVHVPLEQFPAVGRAAEPFLLGRRIGQRLPDAGDRRVVGAFQSGTSRGRPNGPLVSLPPCMRTTSLSSLSSVVRQPSDAPATIGAAIAGSSNV